MNFQATQYAEMLPDVLNNFGDQYLPWVMPIKSLVDAGVRVVFGTDAHVGKLTDNQERFFNNLGARFPYRDSIWPWVGWWVTRELNGKVWAPEEKIDRVTALRGWTNWAAEYLLRADQLGTLEPGKLADLAVMDKDYFAIPEPELMTIQNLMTVSGGKIAYKAPNFLFPDCRELSMREDIRALGLQASKRT